jgi:hypothetical protein
MNKKGGQKEVFMNVCSLLTILTLTLTRLGGEVNTRYCLVLNLFNLDNMHNSSSGFPRVFERVSVSHSNTSTNNIGDGQRTNGVVVFSSYIRNDGMLVYAINSSFLLEVITFY